jgi:hypothetical protein
MEIPPGVCLLVADWGIGDHYLVGALADAVRRKYGLRVWMTGRADLAFLADIYPAVERFVELPAGSDAQQLSTWQVEGGRVFYAHFPKLELMRAVGYNGFHFLDAYRCRLGLPVSANPTRPRPPNAAELTVATTLLQEHGFPPGATVVLGVEARTTPTVGVEADFWIALAAELEAVGLTPLVNAGPSTIVPPGLQALSVPLPAFRAVVQSAGYFCSVRSGLSDLACDVRCPQVVVYPDVRYWGGTLFEGTTFARYGLTKSPHEIIVRPGWSRGEVGEIAAYLAARRPRQVLPVGV